MQESGQWGERLLTIVERSPLKWSNIENMVHYTFKSFLAPNWMATGLIVCFNGQRVVSAT